jgi:hypothetical protein
MATASVTLPSLQHALATAIAAGKHDRARLERAATLVMLGAVSKIDERTYRVASQSTDGTAYTVTPDGCDCPDRKRHPLQRCKHDLAVRLILQAEVDEQRAAEQRRRVLADAVAAADAVALTYARAFGFGRAA